MTKIKIQLLASAELIVVIIMGTILNHYVPYVSIYEFVLLNILLKLFSFSKEIMHYLKSSTPAQ